MGRPSKRSGRKAQLVDVALAMIRERGLDGLHIRDLAAAAGVSPAAIHYYFGDVDGLMGDIHAVIVERYVSRRQAVIAGMSDARDQLTAMIRGGIAESADDAVTIAAYQVGITRRSIPAQVQLRSGYNNQQVTLYVGILSLGVGQGHFTLVAPAADIAQNLVTLEDGYGLHIISRTAALPPDRCLDLTFGYARSATGCPELGRQTARQHAG